jgi:hypothetical protein
MSGMIGKEYFARQARMLPFLAKSVKDPNFWATRELTKLLGPILREHQIGAGRNPDQFEAKQGRRFELAEKRGMAGKSPGKKDFMQSCMQGNVTD